MTPEVYLYQTLHTLDGRTCALADHLALLDMWSQRLFGRPFRPAAGSLARLIAQTAERMGPDGCDRSKFVRLVLPAEGPWRLEADEVSLYRGFELRSVTPAAATLEYDLPLGEAPTSAREAVAAFAAHQARRKGASAAVRCTARGIALTADDAPLLAVRGRTVCGEAAANVFFDLTVKAVRAAGLEFEQRPLRRDELPHCDELFFTDHRGLTALSHCDGVPYMTMLTERVARAFDSLALFGKK